MKVYCVQLDKKYCYFTDTLNVLDDVAVHLESMSNQESLKITILEMSEEDYEKIPEFYGW